LQRIEELTRN